ncbi:MAG: hypothetical protein H7Y03_08575 [Chitinophagaceae bacterium]|nr:hypothetical protein [Chitinophagaceae bacterium]
MKILLLTLFLAGNILYCQSQNIGINATGALPDVKAMLDIASTTTGLLIPRMTTTQRDAIATPPTGLQIFNITTGTIDIYKTSSWQSVVLAPATSNLVYVYSLADLPAPSGASITLDATKMYVFSGIVDISPNYLNLNGANLRGTDPSRDGVMSTVSGGVLRSTGQSVFLENFVTIPASANTKAYDLADATGTKFCNMFSGTSVIEIGIPSLGVGQISGFEAITFNKNYWNCRDGIKITGNVNKFAATFNFITGITAGAGIEFLAGLTIDDIDMSGNYFIYPGQTGVKLNTGATIDRGRMTTNMFRGVTTYITGFDSYSPAWLMSQNTFVPNSRAFGSVFMTNNTTSTSLPSINVFYKVAGTATTGTAQRFTASSNRLTYTGKDIITGRILVIIGAKAPANGVDYSIAIAKNGVIIPVPNGSIAAASNNQSFQITLATEVSLNANDYVEVFLRTNNGSSLSLIVEELQFRITD